MAESIDTVARKLPGIIQSRNKLVEVVNATQQLSRDVDSLKAHMSKHVTDPSLRYYTSACILSGAHLTLLLAQLQIAMTGDG